MGVVLKQFSRNDKLTSSLVFKNVFTDTCCQSKAKHLVLLAAKNNKEFTRLGLAIAKKNVSPAHQRNRIKRIVRESFRHNKNKLADYPFVPFSLLLGTRSMPPVCHG